MANPSPGIRPSVNGALMACKLVEEPSNALGGSVDTRPMAEGSLESLVENTGLETCEFAMGVSSSTAASATAFESFEVCLVLPCDLAEEVEVRLLDLFASREIEREWPWAYGVNVDGIDVRSSMGWASFIVTLLGALSTILAALPRL